MSETNESVSDSESETKGRCRREMESYYADKDFTANRSEWILADAIDRIAADVAEIKAKADSVAPEDVKHFVESEKAWLALVEDEAEKARLAREDRLRQLGFEEPTAEQRKANLALNVALRDWPKD